ncbi:MAG: sugar ABC transporter ATP-binding protein [Fimbriimonadaceae bacterium]|nr:sugar ABC transporter ATP-binding protein [Fimbriimonadaceae bacterium]
MVRLECQGVVKEYPGVRALGGISLDFREGEVHGIIGENGAGKSTLMKILSGVEEPTEGTVSVAGNLTKLKNVRDGMASGIAMIHQELNLVEHLSVAENIFLGREILVGPKLNRREMNELAAQYLADVKSDAKPTDLVGSLPLAQQQLVEITKALSCNADVLIMDEPTAVLSEREKSALFELVKRLKSEGKAIILVSHLLGELIANCDRISVLRDGEFVATVQASEINEHELANMMVGRELGDLFPVKSTPSMDKTLLQSNSLQVKAGEVLGFAGLIGSGRTELWEEICGLRPGELSQSKNYAGSISRGVVYVSEDRKGAGLHLEFSVQDNIVLPWLGKFGKAVTNRKEVQTCAEGWKEKLSIRVPTVASRVGSLSGGNQQKVSLSKWLEGNPEVIILDEPTRGVDVGSKAQIYEIIAQLANQGKGVVVISSEMQELIGLCHRVVVMRDQSFAGELEGEEITEQAMMKLAAGVQSA